MQFFTARCNFISSTSILYFESIARNKNMLELQEFAQSMYEIITEYFEVNLLSINEEKREVLVVPYCQEIYS